MARGLLAALAASLLVGCAAVPIAVRPTPVFPSQLVRLNNGVRAFLTENRGADRVAVHLQVDAGAAHDGAGCDGSAAIVSALLFETRPAGVNLRFREHLEVLGVSDLRVTVGLERTTISFVVPSARITDALTAVARTLANPLAGIDEASLQRARVGRLNQALETELGSAALRQRLFTPGHPYARSLVGTPSTLERLTLTDLQAFTDRRYLPSNLGFALVGALSVDELAAALGTAFAISAPAQRLALEPQFSAPPPPAATGLTLPTQVEANVGQPELLIGFSLPPRPDAPGQADAMADGMMRALREADADHQRVAQMRTDVLEGDEQTVISLQLQPAAEVEAGALREWAASVIDQWRDTTKTMRLNDFTFRETRREARAADRERLLTMAAAAARVLRHGPIPAPNPLLQQFVDTVLMANKYLDSSRMRSVVLVPQTSLRPRAPPPPAAPKIIYPPEQSRALALAPSKERSLQFTLENGLEVTLLERAWTRDIHLAVEMPGGYADGPRGATEWVALLARPLHQPRTEEGWFHVNISADTTRFRFDFEPAAFESSLDLAVRYLGSFGIEPGTEGKISAARLESRQRARATIDAELDESAEAAAAGSLALLAPGVEDMKRSSINEGNQWISRVIGPTHATMVISGNFDAEAIAPQVKKALRAWVRPLAPISPPHFDTARQALVRVTPMALRNTSVAIGCPVSEVDAPSVWEANQLMLMAQHLRLEASFAQPLGTWWLSSGLQLGRGDASRLLWRLMVPPEGDELRRVLTAFASQRDALWEEDELNRARWYLARETSSWYSDARTETGRIVAHQAQGISLARLMKLGDAIAATPLSAVDAAWEKCREQLSIQVSGRSELIEPALAAANLR